MTGKQRATLRAMANTLQPLYQIGKGGIGETMIQQIDLALEARELIKITVHETADTTADGPGTTQTGRPRSRQPRTMRDTSRSIASSSYW